MFVGSVTGSLTQTRVDPGTELERELAGRAEGSGGRCGLGSPLGRWGRPEDVAAAALYLASPEASFITGQAININGGVVM